MIEQPTERAEEIFCSALEIESSDQRQAFLDRSCQGDASLRAMVDQLLASQPGAEKFFPEGGVARLPMKQLSRSLDETPRLADNFDAVAKEDDSVGKCVGPYKLLQRIGEGG